MTLEDDVVRLRPFEDADVPAIAVACQDPEIPRWTAVPSPYTEADARAWLESDEEESFAVVDRASGELLGSIERVVRDEGMAAIIVEQNPRLILPITARAVVLDRGAIVHEGHSAELLADRARLDRWLAVSRA